MHYAWFYKNIYSMQKREIDRNCRSSLNTADESIRARSTNRMTELSNVNFWRVGLPQSKTMLTASKKRCAIFDRMLSKRIVARSMD